MIKGLQTSNMFQIKLIRTVVGAEENLSEFLKEKYPEALYFKVFGNYDILEISTLNRLHEAIRVDSDARILNITTLPCFSLETEKNKFMTLAKEAICPSLILIKLQDQIFENRGIKALYKVASKFCALGDQILPLIGMGYYEIILWFQAQEFQSIFSYIETIRSLKIKDVFPNFKSDHKNKSQLLDSITVPVISYNNIITPKKWDQLDGKILPIMKIKCQPGYEGTISKGLPSTCHQLLGSDDLICMWPDTIKTGEYLKFILTYRKRIPNFSVSDTITEISQNATMPTEKSISDDPPSIDPPFLIIFEQLASFDQKEKINHFLISELINIVSLFNIHIGNRTLSQNGIEIIYSLLSYLRGLLIKYESIIETDGTLNVSKLETVILSYASHIRNSISQQFSSKGYSDVGPQPTFACSLNRIIKAISLIPEQLFDIISSSSVPRKLEEAVALDPEDSALALSYREFKRPWYGFLFLDLSEGYRIIDQGELMVVPYKDIFRFLNWITLSHEVSHGYYVRIEFEVLEKDYLTNMLPTFGKDESEKESYFKIHWRDTIFELFAHWFDYKHFFNSELDFYTWSIWRTHLDITRVHQFKLEYWARSLFIRVSHFWDALKPEMDNINRRFPKVEDYKKSMREFFMVELKKLCDFIEMKFPDRYSEISLNDNEMAEVTKRFLDYYDLCRIFNENYTNQDIIDKINKRYSRLDRDINSIKSGKVVTLKIENPFLFIREILKYYYENPDIQADPPDDATVALIFSFWETSRKYRRPLTR